MLHAVVTIADIYLFVFIVDTYRVCSRRGKQRQSETVWWQAVRASTAGKFW